MATPIFPNLVLAYLQYARSPQDSLLAVILLEKSLTGNPQFSASLEQLVGYYLSSQSQPMTDKLQICLALALRNSLDSEQLKQFLNNTFTFQADNCKFVGLMSALVASFVKNNKLITRLRNLASLLDIRNLTIKVFQECRGKAMVYACEILRTIS